MRVIQNPKKSLGMEKTSKVFLWVIPARVAGHWCGQVQQQTDTAAKSAETVNVTLEIEQRFQQLSGGLSISTGSTGEKSTIRRIPIRTNQVGNRFVINVGDQDLVADADDTGITLIAEPPRPRHWAGIGNPNPLTGLMSFLQHVPLAEPVRLKRGSDCVDTKSGTKAAATR
jgi:hypothetical protein